jgi:hypothetical protein
MNAYPNWNGSTFPIGNAFILIRNPELEIQNFDFADDLQQWFWDCR